MADSHKLLVFTNPVEGKEDEFNQWYNEVHLKEVTALPSFKSAQRFELKGGFPGAQLDWKYLAIYELTNDDPSAVLAELGKGVQTMNMSAAMGDKPGVWMFSSISDVVGG
jgi:hypothetical protein